MEERDMGDIREWFLAPVLHRLHRIENELREIKEIQMSTQKDLDTAEQVLLDAVQKLSDAVALLTTGFDTAPEIAVLTQIGALVSSMAAKIAALGGSGIPVISSSSLAVASVNVPFTFQVVASNKPTSFAAVGLPASLSINSTTGLISGTPSVVGVSSVTITATNASGSGTQVFSLTVNTPVPGAPVITSPLVATGTVNVPFSYQIVATNSPTSFSAVGLLAGLSIDTASGLISGTPTVAGLTAISLMATNAIGSDTESLALTIS